MTLKPFIAMLGFSLSAQLAWAGDIVTEVPSDASRSGKYIFYLHGTAEEEEGGTEKYEAALDAIAEGNATVIAEVREPTDPLIYVSRLAEQVKQLTEQGVPAKNITISGFSKGSIIALAAAGHIADPQLNYVLLAGCSPYLNRKYLVDPSRARGRILAIYDVSDYKFGSCKDMLGKVNGVELKEIERDSGKGHKLFRIPKDKFIEQWRDDLLAWAGA